MRGNRKYEIPTGHSPEESDPSDTLESGLKERLDGGLPNADAGTPAHPDPRTDIHVEDALDNRTSFKGHAARLIFPVGVILVGLAGFKLLWEEPEEAKRPRKPARPIRTTVAELHLQDYQIVVHTQGIVRPHSEVALMAEVSGRIAQVMPEFEDGAFFDEGDVLIELNPVDYETELLTAKAQLADATATHSQEAAKAEQAKLNWEDLGYDGL
jgi:hypothetical protein